MHFVPKFQKQAASEFEEMKFEFVEINLITEWNTSKLVDMNIYTKMQAADHETLCFHPAESPWPLHIFSARPRSKFPEKLKFCFIQNKKGLSDADNNESKTDPRTIPYHAKMLVKCLRDVAHFPNLRHEIVKDAIPRFIADRLLYADDVPPTRLNGIQPVDDCLTDTIFVKNDITIAASICLLRKWIFKLNLEFTGKIY